MCLASLAAYNRINFSAKLLSPAMWWVDGSPCIHKGNIWKVGNVVVKQLLLAAVWWKILFTAGFLDRFVDPPCPVTKVARDCVHCSYVSGCWLVHFVICIWLQLFKYFVDTLSDGVLLGCGCGYNLLIWFVRLYFWTLFWSVFHTLTKSETLTDIHGFLKIFQLS